jgi:hypothetical protein
MPLVLLAFSVAVQQALVVRYGLVTIAGFAPVLAGLLRRLPQLALLALASYFATSGALTAERVAGDARGRYHAKDRLIEELERHAAVGPIVFESRQDMVPVLHYAPRLAPRSAFLDFADAQIPRATALRVCGRDVARRYAELYPEFRLIDLDAVLELDRFLIVAWSAELGAEFPGFEVRRLGPRLFELRRREAQGSNSPR